MQIRETRVVDTAARWRERGNPRVGEASLAASGAIYSTVAKASDAFHTEFKTRS